MIRAIITAPILALAACSSSDAPTNDRYQFVRGSGNGIDLVFDRATGCVAEIKRSLSIEEFNAGTPVFDPNKPFTTEDAPDWAQPTEAEKAKAPKAKAKPEAGKGEADSGDFFFNGPIQSFEVWRCPQPLGKSEGMKK